MKWGYEGGVSIRAILTKALAESPEGGFPVGVWKPKRQKAMAFLYLDDLLDLVREVYEPK